MNRRKFLQQGSLICSSFICCSHCFCSRKKAKSFKAAFLSDVHVKPTEAAEQGMRKAYRHVNALKPSVDFIINGGDAIMDALNASKDKVQKQWDVWNTRIER
jgi:Icc protein